MEEVEDRLSLFDDPPFAEACYGSDLTAKGYNRGELSHDEVEP
ncbi:MAG: hypothetical protein P5702_00560 [Limnospira sp. PMC 1291.21]|uniref:Uncharacterized protein n=1 Tax=Limnospira fusiformis PMC 851.14 TaxID=2219512 RepID=A0ABU9EH35_LIMFS|nr:MULTISPECIES: hypothetical protein [unclassified Limnospira]EKD08915.1 hypothetical protein SPLC1_S203160 [Arthrospira platensis C1]MDY7051131.1 hypothetical protein [Limnospira fusiformis LS22]MDT9186773.1 hypothetical protein [Limnospira sp. PMC 894.15]MDT9191454.1 hypothetical protein [Limnospira sp. PMC 1245.20]MDT9201635.1 hypothetical protein [Limnospira sp. PMC 1243.20]